MRRVLITGIAGYLGRRIAEGLENMDQVESIVGLDLERPAFSLSKLEFVRHDVRDDLGEIISGGGIDCVVHAAFILKPLYDTAYMESVNLGGTLNVLKGCIAGGVRHILHCSSTTAYGFHADNPLGMDEESALRGNHDFTYSKDKRALEEVCKDFAERHPEICLTVIRPCFVVGPGLNNPLSRHLRRPLVILPLKTAPMQFIHEDDLLEIVLRLLLEQRPGAYNLVADGTLSVEEMVAMLGNIPLKLPLPFLRPFNSLMWRLRLSALTEMPTPALNMIIHPWLASNAKLKRELGYRFRYTTREAFDDFARHVRSETGGAHVAADRPAGPNP